MYLCLSGGEQHRRFKVNQFVIKEVENPHEPSEMIKCLIYMYTENGSENRSGGMHQVHLENKVVRHYANPILGNRCLCSWWNCTFQNYQKMHLTKIIFIESQPRM